MKKNNNQVIQIGSIETPDGLFDIQGYRVYSTDGISVTITSGSGGLGPTGLYVVKMKDERKE